MANLSFLKSDDGAATYEVYRDGELVGLVWERDGSWFADPFRMSAAAIQGADRETAALNLMRVIDEEKPLGR